MLIFIGKNGNREGPYPVEELPAMLADGRLGREDLAWRAGMPAWVRLGDFLVENGLAPAEAPPLPGAVIAPTVASAQGHDAEPEEIAALAGARLEGKYWPTFGITFLAGLIGGLPGVVPFIGAIIRLFIEPVMSLGATIYMMKRARSSGPAAEVNDIFEAFKFYGRALGIFWYLVLWLMLWMSPGLMALIAGFGLSKVSVPAGATLMFAGALACATAMVIALYRYGLHFLLCLDNPAKPVTACLDESVRLMSGHKVRLFLLQLHILWKPYLAFMMGMAAIGVASAVLAVMSGNSSDVPAMIIKISGVFIAGSLILIPAAYFMVRAGLRARIAWVIFYDERVWLDRRKAPDASL